MKTWGLKTTLIAAMVLLLGFFLLLDRVYEHGILESRQSEQHAIADVRETLYTLTLSLNTPTMESVHREFSSRAIQDEMELLLLTDETGKILHATQSDMIGKHIGTIPLRHEFKRALFDKALEGKQIQTVISEDRHSVIGYAPITLPAQKGEIRSLRTGVIYLHYDLSDLKSRGWHRLGETSNLILWLSEFLLLSLLLYGLLERLVFRPLKHLEEITQRFGQGEWSAQSELTGRSELAKLGQAFNTMRGEIIEDRSMLLQNQQRWQSLIENLQVGVVIHGADSKIITSNQMASQLLRLDRANMVGRDRQDIVWHFLRNDGSKMPFEEYPISRILANGETLRDLTLGIHFESSGETTWVQVNAMPLFDENGAIQQVIVTFMDITARKLAEAELEQHRMHLQELVTQRTAELDSLFQALPDLYFRMNREGTILDYRSGNRQDLYVDPEVFLNKRMQDVLPQDVGMRIHDQIQHAIDQKKMFSLEYALNLDNREQYFEARIQYLRDDEVVAVIRNISERKQTEHELIFAKESAESANRAKSIFLANMSHELRTPLNAILGFAQLMARDKRIPPDQLANLQTINRSGQHLLSLINDVLEIAKIESGRLTQVLQDFNLPDLLESLVEVIELRARNKGLLVSMERDPSLPVHVRTDLGKFRQILLNLLSNAVKYTEHGEIVLTVRLASQEGTYAKLVFEIRDTGVGITAQDQEKLFQPFYQTEYGIKLGEGTGLGLAICRQYTELLGGTISLESKVGQGSVFTVTLPVEVLPGMAPSSHATHVQHIAGGQSVFRILVAEDKPDNQRLISELLERVGFEVRIAQNGEQAVEMFQSWHPDFIWMDMRMPVMSGYEAAKTIRGLPGGQDIPIVALTASAFEEDRANILEAGCNDWLRKPVDADRIFEMMAQYLKLTYVYAKEVTESVNESGMENVIEGETLLSDLPDRIKDELRQAAMLLDAEAIRNIALQIAADHPAAADCLRNAAEQYNFEQLQQRLK